MASFYTKGIREWVWYIRYEEVGQAADILEE